MYRRFCRLIGIDVILSERTAGRGGEKLHRRAGLSSGEQKGGQDARTRGREEHGDDG
jgi:hypothetical protein